LVEPRHFYEIKNATSDCMHWPAFYGLTIL